MNYHLIAPDGHAFAEKAVKLMPVAPGVSYFFLEGGLGKALEPATGWSKTPAGELGWWPVHDAPPIEARRLLTQEFVPTQEATT